MEDCTATFLLFATSNLFFIFVVAAHSTSIPFFFTEYSENDPGLIEEPHNFYWCFLPFNTGKLMGLWASAGSAAAPVEGVFFLI